MASAIRVAIVTGATRGIGRQIALDLADSGCHVVVTGKSTESTPELPGSIYTVADEVTSRGVEALPLKVDVRDASAIQDMVQQTVDKFGRVDYLINNAGALWWKPIVDTPMDRYDLINNINARATFCATQAVLPHMLKQGYGHIITQSPPIQLNALAGMTAYLISKFGMTLTALGVGQELKGTGVAANSIWPVTMIESYATINHKMGEEKMWRKADILSDAIMGILAEDPKEFTGNMLLDEVYLRQKGVTDFSKYQCVPGFEPPKMTELKDYQQYDFKRGKVKDLKSKM